MTICDLEGFYHPASIDGDLIHILHLIYTAEGFVLSGLKLVDYSEEEERELVQLGVLTSRI